MPRRNKPHEVRRVEIIGAAERLIASKGYERMTVQDVLDELGIAKGTLYHYFRSKQAILEAVTARVTDAMDRLLVEIVGQRSELTPPQQLNAFFATFGRHKVTQLPVMGGLLQVWYADDNALPREKLRIGAQTRIAPLLADIIRRGSAIREFEADYPDEVAGVVLSLAQDLVDRLARQLLSSTGAEVDTAITQIVAAYTESIERTLGPSRGWLVIADAATVAEAANVLVKKLEEP